MKFIERLSRKSAQQPQPADPGQAPLLMALEPRIMFDASVGVVAQDAAAQTTADAAKDSTSDNDSSQAPAATGATASQQQGSQRHEVVFIDGQVSNVEQLLAGVSANAEVVVLDPEKDGLQQMADYLKGRENLDAIHLLSHGADGTVQLGNLWLASNNLAEHRAALESIGATLKADGDLMLYGCDVGQGDKGQAFLDQLASITGADVAASVDDTGAAALGGNWTLERSSGTIETSALSVSGYDGLLVSSYSGGFVTSAPVLGSGTSLMRYVVGDFNGDGRSDVLFQAAGTNAPWSLALGNADGTFSISDQANSMFNGVTLLDAHTGGTNYHAADFNGDGRIDLLAAAVTGGTMNLYINTGSGFTTTALSGPSFGNRTVVGDFNRDGAADILYQSAGTGSNWYVMMNNGSGSFTTVLSTDASSPFRNVNLIDFSAYLYKAADMDGDGYTDILITPSNQAMRYLHNNNGTFEDLTSSANLPAPSVNRVVVADFDGDGDADILYQTLSNGVWKYVRNDNGTFVDVAQGASPFSGVVLPDMANQQYRVGDFDGDGDIDLMATSSTAGQTSVFVQSGSLPRLVSSTPADNSLTVAPSANITLTFNEAVTKGTGNIYIVRTSDNQIIQTIDVTTASVTGSGTTWTIDPPADMIAGVAYAVRIDNKTFANANGQVYKGIRDNTTLNFTVSAVAAPVIGNFNGDTVAYVEGASYVLLDDGGNATVTDADSANFSGGKLTVQITTGLSGSEDVLFIRDEVAGANKIILSGASIMYNGLVIGTYTGGSNGSPLVVTFTSNANPTTVAALVHNLAYRNSNTTEPNTTPRTVSISMDDGAGGNSAVSEVTLNVLAVNDAPVVNLSASNPTYTENTSAVQLFSGATVNTVESGQKVIQMTFSVSGVANGAAEKLLIDGSDVTLINGTSLTTNSNSITVTVSVTSGTANVTLSSGAGLDVATVQTILNTMAYRNDSESPNTANRVVTLNTLSDNGGTDNGGIPTIAVGVASTVTVVGINDAPVLAGGPYSLPSINEDTTSSGTQILTLLTNYTMVDPDVGAQRGIAVITKSGNGIWQYSTDNANWTDFGTVSSTSALLLASTTYIRYVPDGANGETASLTFRGWDQTTGMASVNGIRGTADTTSNGGTTAFSIVTAVANQPVTSVNDAPVMVATLPTLTGLNDTSTNNAGNLVSSLIGGITDVDTGAVKGIAITELTGTYGKWQFSLDNGTSWTDVGAVSNTTALILNTTNKVRYVPDGVHGETATLIYKAWDQTSGTAGLEGTKRDTTISGGTSAYSSGTDTASVVVTAVNDAPVVTVSSGAASWSEGNNVASNPVAVDPGLTLVDADGPNPLSASARMLTYFSSQDTLSFVNDGLTMGNIIGTWTVGTGTLTLTSAGNQATVAQFEAALRAITYNNSSNSPNSTTRTVQFIVTDGSNAQSTAVTRDVTITAVNDSPTISAVASLPVTEDTQTPLSQITFSDVDTTLGVATFSVGSGTLSAIGAGGVTVGGTATALTLSGTLANINNFIAANRLLYTPAANASGDVTLTININTTSVSDATTTVTLQVAAVNDAPVISTPASITVTEDVSSVISGFSFTDVDAGINIVTATFSVPSGTLSATTGMGVTVSGSETGELTLSGSLADINFFVAANGVTFKTAQDATASVTLTVTLNDKGFSGSGGEKTDTKTVTLNVSAVNDAPVNNVPGAQTASQNIALGFNTANGNAISITDVDAGNGLMTVTLTATNGTLSLSSLSGITLLLGTGTNDGSMIFEGNRANINAALQTLSFKSGSSFLGAASLTIETNDNGNSGSGGAKTDVDTISINVIPVNPKVTSVSAQGLDRTVKIGDEVLISMTWDQVVNVDLGGGSPSLLLETGLVDREAVYVSGSGSNTLVFKYTVQAGDLSADLDFQSTAALQLNGAAISNNTSDLAVLTLPTVGGVDSLGGRSNIVVDGVVPVVANVSAPSDGTYIIGQNLDFTVNFSENVVVDTTTGVPRIAVTLDTGGTAYADYVSGSGGSALVFRLTVASGQLDANGVTLGSSVQLNNGSIRDTAGNTIEVTLNSVASTADVNVDGVVPTVVSVTTPLDGNYKAGDVLTFTVNASEALQTGSLPPRLVLDVGGVTRYATYVSGSGSAALVFQYVVQAGDNDNNGIAINSLDLRGEQLTDLAGNDLNLTLNSVGNTAGVVVDTTAPSVGTIVRADANPSNSGSVSFTVTFSEDVSGVDANDFGLVFSGTAGGSISSVTAVDGRTYTVVVGGLSGSGSVRLDLNNSGTGIVDAAGNAVTGGLTGAAYGIDRIAPSVNSVDVPANGTYVAGQNLDFTVHLDEAVQLNTSNGTPRIEVLLDNGTTAYATYLSGGGTNALVFRLTVANGQLDTNGITLGSGIQLNGATLRDSIGNNANLALNNVGDTSEVRVDAVAPTVSTVGLPAPGAYNAGDVLRFTVNTSENVIVDTSTGTPRLALNIGGVTRYASYVSGSGSSALVFEYTVQAGNNAAAGIGLPGVLDLNGASARDAAGNALNLALNTPGAAGGVVIDTVAPQVGDIVNVDLTPTNAGSVRYTVTFDESVSGVDSADFSLAFTGTASGRIASVEQVNGRTYTIVVDNLAGVGNVRLDLNSTGTGIVDIAGNPITGGLEGSSYSIDRVAPSVTSVGVPASGTYVAGQTLDFTVNTDEAVLVDSGDGNPRLAITLDNGRVVYADYLSGSASNALVFRLTVTNGMAGNGTFAVASSIDLNGGTLRDARGNDANTGLSNVGDTRGILVDARAPRPSSIVVDGPVLPTDRSISFTLTFDEAVSGVDASDFTVLGTSSASGTVQSVQQIDAKTYRIVVGDMRGQGALSLSLNAPGSGISDGAGNLLAVSLVGQSQSIQTQDVGDLNYRVDPPATATAPATVVLQPQVPGIVVNDAVSPLVPQGLFDVRTVGGNIQPLGTIFLGNAGSAPSFIAQVFGSSDSGIGGGQGGFLGFGGGDGGGVFGSSTFAAVFGREVPGVSEMNVFNGSQWKQSDINQGLRGVFGVPTFGQQLQQINEADQRHVRELAMALAQPAQIGKRA